MIYNLDVDITPVFFIKFFSFFPVILNESQQIVPEFTQYSAWPKNYLVIIVPLFSIFAWLPTPSTNPILTQGIAICPLFSNYLYSIILPFLTSIKASLLFFIEVPMIVKLGNFNSPKLSNCLHWILTAPFYWFLVDIYPLFLRLLAVIESILEPYSLPSKSIWILEFSALKIDLF